MCAPERNEKSQKAQDWQPTRIGFPCSPTKTLQIFPSLYNVWICGESQVPANRIGFRPFPPNCACMSTEHNKAFSRSPPSLEVRTTCTSSAKSAARNPAKYLADTGGTFMERLGSPRSLAHLEAFSQTWHTPKLVIGFSSGRILLHILNWGFLRYVRSYHGVACEHGTVWVEARALVVCGALLWVFWGPKALLKPQIPQLPDPPNKP